MKEFETNGIKLENGNMGCPKCNGESFKTVAHADGKDYFTNYYQCNKCGEPVWTKHKRSKASRAYWG